MSKKQSATADIWLNQKQSLTKFFKEVLEMDIDISIDIPKAPKSFVGLLYIPQIKCEIAIKAYKKLFGENSVDDADNECTRNVDEMIGSQQARPNAPYFIRHRNGDEPDKIHLEKFSFDFCEDGNQYMIPLEGILFALYYRWTTNNSIDKLGVTILYAQASAGWDFEMGIYDDQFGLNGYSRDGRYNNSGPRQVYFKDSLPKK